MNKETKCAAQYFMLCLLWFSGAGATSWARGIAYHTSFNSWCCSCAVSISLHSLHFYCLNRIEIMISFSLGLGLVKCYRSIDHFLLSSSWHFWVSEFLLEAAAAGSWGFLGVCFTTHLACTHHHGKMH
jgi:hypothetical protein